jgi:putative transposase
MSIGGYKIRNKKEAHFISFAVVEWIDVFTRKEYCDILLDSIQYSQNTRGLLLHSWCVMSNHVHLIASANGENISEILRDFKKYTSRQIVQSIANNKRESRKDWMLKIFRQQGSLNVRNKELQFWRQDNHPVELYSPKFILQRVNYVHNNPVRAGIVERAEDYLYSSAKDYKSGKKSGLLDVVFL